MKRKASEKLSDQLRRIVADCGLSRYEISKRTGIDEAVLSKFVHGQRGISTDSWDKLGDCLALRLVADDPSKKRKGR